MLDRSLHHILRPNLILYLDAPVEVVSIVILVMLTLEEGGTKLGLNFISDLAFVHL